MSYTTEKISAQEKVNAVVAQATEKIIKIIEDGNFGKWQKSWADTGCPTNAVTNKPYNGNNAFLLALYGWIAGYPTANWIGFGQSSDAGGHIRKGEKGTAILVPIQRKFEKEDIETGEMKEVSFCQYIVKYVWNVAQCDGLPESFYVKSENSCLEIESAVSELIEKHDIKMAEGQPAYSPTKDIILMPKVENFGTSDNYCATLLHEIAHWTGHSDRCARDLSGRRGSTSYAKEELIAEFGSAMLCAQFGIAQSEDHHKSHAAYLSGWVSVLKEKKTALMEAVKLAQRAVDFVMSK